MKLHLPVFTDFQKLPPKVRSAVRELEKETALCTGFLVNICLSYGSRAEIVMACNSAVAEKYEREQSRLIQEHASSSEVAATVKSNPKKAECIRSEPSVPSPTALSTIGEESYCVSSPSVDCTSSSSATETIGLEQTLETSYSDDNNETIGIEDHVRKRIGAKMNNSSSSSSRSSSSSSSSSRGRILSTCSEPLPDIKSMESCDAHRTTSVKFLELDDEILSRHMCTAQIPGEVTEMNGHDLAIEMLLAAVSNSLVDFYHPSLSCD